MSYDPDRQVSVLFGGTDFMSNAETWEWNGTVWTQRVVANGPTRRFWSAMAYDRNRGVTVMFGGLDNITAFNPETWEWDGVTWTRRQVSGPSGRFGHAMAYDAARGVMVLFGGRTPGTVQNTSVQNAETWEWDGATWTQRMVSGPTARERHSMVYDAHRGVVVLFGGNAQYLWNAETWEWDGATWTQRVVDHPAPRQEQAMAYDATRRTTVLFGGFTGSINQPSSETWELVGTCPADLDNDGDFTNGLTRDGAVTIEDLLSFLVGFESGNVLVDLDNGTYTGTPDNAVDINDLLFFLVRFEEGC